MSLSDLRVRTLSGESTTLRELTHQLGGQEPGSAGQIGEPHRTRRDDPAQLAAVQQAVAG